MKKIISKGYTVELTSWENDGDNYRTKSQTYDTKEEALAIKSLCLSVFQSCNNGETGIGNMMDDEDPTPIIVEYVIHNPQILDFSDDENLIKPSSLKELIEKKFPEEIKRYEWQELIHDYLECADNGESIKKQWYNIIMEYNGQLLGYSEYYISRIAENVSVYYSDKDIYLEEIEE